MPGVEQGRLDIVFITQDGHGHLFDQVPPKDRDFLLGRIMLTSVGHVLFSVGLV